MEKFLWLLRNKVISFLLILVPINIIFSILTSVFVESSPTLLGVMCILCMICLFFFNIFFLVSDFNLDELVRYIEVYFKKWWAKKPK